jgi:two-component system sensor histidine kinase UhpB
MSIQWRLILATALVLALALAAMVAASLARSAPRLHAESASVMRLSHEFVERAVRGLTAMRDPEAGLADLIAGLRDLRHVEITLRPATGVAAASPTQSSATSQPSAPSRAAQGDRARPMAEPEVPRWLLALVAEPRSIARVPVAIAGRDLGTIEIAARATDEIKEIWDTTAELLLYSVALGTLALAVASLVIGRALAPLGQLADALGRLEVGDYAKGAPEAGPPEIAAIGAQINGLAKALIREQERNRQLTRRIIDVGDAERRELAREMHDELGPHLFAVRAGASALRRESEKSAPDAARLAAGSRSLLDHVCAIQECNRRVLEKLRPDVLASFGLATAIDQLAVSWQTTRPDVAISCDIGATSDLGEKIEITIYRFVQEGLTNAFRHAAATGVAVAVEASNTEVVASVRDDGSGMPDTLSAGLGLTGMRERTEAVGGRLEISSRQGYGTVLVMRIPRPEKSGGSGLDCHVDGMRST